MHFAVVRAKRRAVVDEDFFDRLSFAKAQSGPLQTASIAFVRCAVDDDGGVAFVGEAEDNVQPLLKRRMVKDLSKAVHLRPTVVESASKTEDDNTSEDNAGAITSKAKGTSSATSTKVAVGSQGTLLVCPPKLSALKQVLVEDLGSSGGLEFRNQYGKRVLHITDRGNDVAKLSYIYGTETRAGKDDEDVDGDQSLPSSSIFRDMLEDGTDAPLNPGHATSSSSSTRHDIIKLEGTSSEQFYKARTALYKRSVCI